MNFFCRIFGHTWVHKVDDPKIRWTTDAKTLAELNPTVSGEPEFYMECARCSERGEWAKSAVEERLKSLDAAHATKKKKGDEAEDSQETAGASA